MTVDVEKGLIIEYRIHYPYGELNSRLEEYKKYGDAYFPTIITNETKMSQMNSVMQIIWIDIKTDVSGVVKCVGFDVDFDLDFGVA